MSRNYYSEINLHVTWHTKGSLPLLTPRVEPLAHRSLKHKLVNTAAVFVHEIGGTETHVHLSVTCAPTLTIQRTSARARQKGLAETFGTIIETLRRTQRTWLHRPFFPDGRRGPRGRRSV